MFGLLAGRTIQGRVTLGDTVPLSGASVLVKGLDGGGTEYWAFTSAEGIYQVSGLTRGNYSITPFKAGHDFQPRQR